MKPHPVCKTNCPTCPFIPGSPHADLAPALALSALTEASRICHSTGANNAINRRTGKRPRLCRGARDIQLAHFHRIGFISEPTDKAWAAKLQEINRKSK